MAQRLIQSIIGNSVYTVVVVVVWDHHKGVSTPPCCSPLKASSFSPERHQHPHPPSPENCCSLEISSNTLIRENTSQSLLWHFHPPLLRHSPCPFLTGLSWFHILRNWAVKMKSKKILIFWILPAPIQANILRMWQSINEIRVTNIRPILQGCVELLSLLNTAGNQEDLHLQWVLTNFEMLWSIQAHLSLVQSRYPNIFLVRLNSNGWRRGHMIGRIVPFRRSYQTKALYSEQPSCCQRFSPIKGGDFKATNSRN